MKNLFKTKLLALLLSVAGLFCVSSMYAWHIDAGKVYFDNTVTNWSNVYIRFGTTSWCTVYKMSKMDDNANIYEVNFGGTVPDITAVQFAAVDGYNVTSGCNNDCGIFNGNVIPNGQKTAYVEADITGSSRLVVATGNTNYCAVSALQPMPNSVEYYTTTLGGGTISAGGTVGYFTAGQKVTFAGTTSLGYSSFPAGVSNEVHPTFKYYLSGSTYSNITCSASGSANKSFSKSVTLPSAVGKYTMSSFYACGDQKSAVRTSYYHIVGVTGQDLNFGAVTASGSLTKTESLTNVWGGDDVNSVSATITEDGGTNYFTFADETTSQSVAISDKKGSVDIVFHAPASDYKEKSATLTLTLTCTNGSTVVKTYQLTGIARIGGITIIKSSKATLLPGPKAILHGYMQYTGCDNITERGFYYGTSTIDPKSPATGTTKVTSDDKTPMVSGDTWDCQIPASNNLATSTTYHFIPYVLDSNGDTHCSETEYTFRTGDACNYDLSGDTIYFTVDNALTEDDNCALKFINLEHAVNFIKSSSTFYNSTTKNLNYNIVMLVAPSKARYEGTTDPGQTGGDCDCAKVNMIKDINNSASPAKYLVVRSASTVNKPTLVHITIRNSKNIVFDNVRIEGHNTKCTSKSKGTIFDNALDVDNGSGWETSSYVENGNVTFKNCYVYSQGFTCMHAAGFSGITFENCEIEAMLDDDMKQDGNTNSWGASIKFIHCKNIKFLRNNFRGSHSSSIWAQGLKNSLFMNNVFWNDNTANYTSMPNNVAFIRLINQYGDKDKNTALGFYYNTLYLAENSNIKTDRKIDFFRLGSEAAGLKSVGNGTEYYDYENIAFQYNNCYSFDVDVSGRNTSGDYSAFLSQNENLWCTAVNNNNFWSYYDLNHGNTSSAFQIPASSSCTSNKYYYVNVAELLCSTAADDPGTLVIKGTGLNVGYHVSSEVDKSGLGAETYYNDRLHPSNGADAVRNKDGNWTLGAYQQSEGDAPIETIVWWGDENGGSDDWDNRNNWRKLDGTRVTCVDNLATDLKVIIPAPESDVYPVPEGGITTYPFLPTKFSGERTKISQETVNAGHGISNPSMFASTIELEYGASIKGITALKDDDARRYTEAANHFEAGRKEWILVGTVVKPFAGDSKESTRLIKSGDYYLNKTPHVYMRQAKANGESVNWNTPFASLEEAVDYDKVFAIKLPDQYGPYKLKAEEHYTDLEPDPVMAKDGNVSKTYNFNGWFLNDEVYPEYKLDGNTLLCNTYPANIDIAEAIAANKGAFKVYDYSIKNFVEKGTGEIKSQNGFLFCPTIGVNNGYFRITKDMLLDTNTKYKSATVQNPYFTVLAINTNGDGGSVAVIKYDELKADKYVESVDLLNTVIENTPTQPEISVAMYSKELDKVVVPDLTKSIPLKLVCGAKMTVEFGKYEMLDIEKAELEDRETGKSYDLLKEKPQIALAKGTYEGRFYLNLGEVEEDVPTDVDDVTSGAATIDIYGNGKSVIITSSENVILKSAEITDMAGRTTYVTLKNPHYNKVNIKGAQGVYIVKAIGDIMSETTKVIVK